jgi:C-terminal processing protease CtpA/Prc
VAEGVALLWIDQQSPAPGLVSAGDLLVEVDGEPADDFLNSVRLRPGSTPSQRRWNAVSSLAFRELLPGEGPSPKTVSLRNGRGQTHTVNLQWKPVDVEQPTPHCVCGRLLGESLGYLDIRSFYCRDELGQVSDLEFRRQLLAAAAPLANVRKLIVDLRGNGGGRDQQAQLAASLLTSEEIEWVRYRHRMFPHAANAAAPQASFLRPYHLPLQLNPSRLLLLIGPATFSTAEVFVGAFCRRRSVTAVGEPTGGGAGNPVEFRLPLSGLTVNIPVSEYFLAGSDRELIEGKGIEPRIRVVASAADLRLGRDTVLETAIETARIL